MRVCVDAILYMGTSVRACMCTYASRIEQLGSLNNMFSLHDSSPTNSLSKLGRNIRMTRTNQLLRVRFTTLALCLSLSFPSPDNSLVFSLYPPETFHFTRADHLPLPSPKSTRLWGVHRHRTGWRLVGRTLRFTLQTV